MKRTKDKPKPPRGVYERVKGSDVWWIRFTDADGRKRREKVSRKSDAIDLLAKRHTEVLQRRKLPENFRVRGVTFKTLCHGAVDYSAGTNTPKSTHELQLKINELLPAFGNRIAEQITTQELHGWLTREAESRDWKPSTVNRWRSALSLVYRVAIENTKETGITENPAAKIKKKAEHNARSRYLSPEEEAALRSALSDPVQIAAVEIALNTGMRASEQFGLRWRQVTMDGHNPHIALMKTKSGKGRTINLNQKAVRAFASIRSKDAKRTAPVFPSGRREGEAVLSARGWFRNACERAGVLEFTWHDLRHSFASRLVSRGTHLKVVAELMGHSTIALSARYSHFAPGVAADAVRLLD